MNEKQALTMAILLLMREMKKLNHYIADYELHKRYFSSAHENACKRWHKYREAIEILEAIKAQPKLF